MNRRSSSVSWAGAAIAVAWLGAPEAYAAEGGLEVFPRWFTELPVLIALFAVLILPVNAILLRPLLRVLDERSDRIEGARARAAEISARADEVLARYESTIAGARAQGERERRTVLERARQEQTDLTRAARAEAEGEIERARAEVGEALVAARGSLRDEAQALAVAAAGRILGRSLS
jgi:F-type H+-transporting ATPase subunit b